MTELVKLTGWTHEEADALTGDIENMQGKCDPAEAAGEILAACDPE